MALFVVTVLVAVLLPFVVLLRTSILLYVKYGAHYGFAICVGLAFASIIVATYAHFLVVRLGFGSMRVSAGIRVSGLVVAIYVVWALVYISAANVKTSDVRATYTTTHPLLRLSVATLVVFDREAVITDLQRSRADYSAMGLPTRERSMHYRQSDGFSHAIDLRTVGHSGIRNALVVTYFRLIGLRTLRHVGTADHLHIALPMPT